MKPKFLFLFYLPAIFLIFLTSCVPSTQREERLAKQYCSSCHLFPQPSLLDKVTWTNDVLPQMAFRMGFSNVDILSTLPPDDLPIIVGTIPSKPMVTPQEWEAITKYFIRNSPDSLVIEEVPAPKALLNFDVEPLESFRKTFVTLIQYDSLNRKTYVGNRSGKLYELDSNLKILDSVLLSSAPSHLIMDGGDRYVSVMGIMDPNDQSKGTLIKMPKTLKLPQILVDSLQRPVYFEKTDFNEDGIDDFIICSFGNFTGALQIFEGKPNNKFIQHNLNSFPGARKVLTGDFNKDGHKDILALMTQGDERLVLYVNKGGLEFAEKTLARFPPVYGSNYFEIVDFNKDGFFDILYVNGDNGDYSAILKPYHGIQVLLNDGNNNFSSSISLKMQGASQAVVRDFDHDGDLDIAAIAFFTDFKRHPERSFIYFENTGDGSFVSQVTNLAITGRWLVMETADYDQDGDLDIILGAANFGGMGANSINSKWRNRPSTLLLLKNRLARRK